MSVRAQGLAAAAALAALLSLAGAAATGGEPADGAALYERECSKCHGRLDAARGAAREPALWRVAARGGGGLAFAMPFGPDLAGVVGRPAGSVPGYEYSRAFRSATRGLVWSEATLDAFLTDTQVFARGVRMYYRQPEPDVRARIIAYLAGTGAR